MVRGQLSFPGVAVHQRPLEAAARARDEQDRSIRMPRCRGSPRPGSPSRCRGGHRERADGRRRTRPQSSRAQCGSLRLVTWSSHERRRHQTSMSSGAMLKSPQTAYTLVGLTRARGAVAAWRATKACTRSARSRGCDRWDVNAGDGHSAAAAVISLVSGVRLDTRGEAEHRRHRCRPWRGWHSVPLAPTVVSTLVTRGQRRSYGESRRRDSLVSCRQSTSGRA